jgi:hypothetical protein
MNYKHYIFTRFNYPSDYGYLNKRLDIFNKITFPSFLNQTNKNFTWLISVNPIHKDLFNSFLDRGINIQIIEEVEPSPFLSFLNKESQVNYLITSRIDNDDAIHKDYIQTIHESFSQDQSTRIIDGNGYRLLENNEQYYFNCYHPKFISPFSTLIYKDPQYPIDSSSTIFASMHTQLHHKFSKIEFIPNRNWIQYIHDSNISNKGRGHEKTSINFKDFNLAV